MGVSDVLNNVHFLYPHWLWLIIPVLLFLLLKPLLISKGWLLQDNLALSATSVKHPLAINDLSVLSKVKPTRNSFFILICSTFLFVSLAQPVRTGEKVAAPPTSADILLIVDTSISMVIKDYQLQGKQIDRMSMTQVLLDRFSRRFNGRRIGIIVLGDQANILLEPSEDKALVRHLIYRLKPAIGGRQAALGDAVAIAADYIKLDKTLTETVLVLMSDGVRPAGKLSPVAGAKRAADANVVLHTIVIGSAQQNESHLSGKQAGGLIYESADFNLLKKMAEITGGESFHGVDVDAIDNALNRIEQRHQIKDRTEFTLHSQQPLYAWPLLCALLLLLVNELLSANDLLRHVKRPVND